MSKTRQLVAEPGEKSLRLIRWEIGLTSAQLAASIAYLQFRHNGLDISNFGTANALMVVVQLLFNVPAGVVADWLSQKWLNVIGDAMAFIGFMCFALSSTFGSILIAYAIVGAGNAISMGANYTLLARHASDYATVSNMPAHETFVRELTKSKQLVFLLMALSSLGMPVLASWLGVGAAIGIVGLTFLAGAILALRVDDLIVDGSQTPNPMRHAKEGVLFIFRHRGARPWVVAYLVSMLVWQPSMAVLFTPTILAAGISESNIGICWAMTIVVAYFATRAARQYTSATSVKERDRQPLSFIIATLPALLAASILSVDVNYWTIGAYVGFGFSLGWSQSLMMAYIQQHIDPKYNNTVVSTVTTLVMACGAILVILYGYLASVSIGLAMTWTAIPFSVLVLGIFSWCRASTKTH